MLTVGGLFSGIGGIELGLERAGMHVLWHCEADPYARAVLEQHWPGVPCYEDVRKLRGADVEPVGVLCGGFPCPGFSFAGRGEGFDHAGSGLWSEYARLVGELRPRYVVVENVAALLGRGLGRVLRDLSALGYDAEWDCIPASAVGAPHRRDRVWLVAYPDADHGGLAVDPQRDITGLLGSLEGEQRGYADGLRDDVADAENVGHERAGPAWDWRPGFAHGRSGAGDDPWAVEPDVGRVATRIPARVDRLHALGNALVPQIAELIGRRIIEWEGGLT